MPWNVLPFVPRRKFPRWKLSKPKPLHIVHRSGILSWPNQHKTSHRKVINFFLGKVGSNLHRPHRRPSWGLLDPFKNRGRNAMVNVVEAKIKVTCF
jgi:hypothetical protein